MFIDTFDRGTKVAKHHARVARDMEKRKERYAEIFSLYRSDFSLSVALIGKKYGISRQRTDQILKKFPEYKEVQQARFNVRVPFDRSQTKDKTCPQCSKVFPAKYPYKTKYCSRDCFRLGVTIVEYPSWRRGRSLLKENFTIDEWREINNIRTRSYYQRNVKVQRERHKQYQRERYKEFGAIYHKRAYERKQFGHATTPLKNPKNLGAIKP